MQEKRKKENLILAPRKIFTKHADENEKDIEENHFSNNNCNESLYDDGYGDDIESSYAKNSNDGKDIERNDFNNNNYNHSSSIYIINSDSEDSNVSDNSNISDYSNVSKLNDIQFKNIEIPFTSPISLETLLCTECSPLSLVSSPLSSLVCGI